MLLLWQLCLQAGSRRERHQETKYVSLVGRKTPEFMQRASETGRTSTRRSCSDRGRSLWVDSWWMSTDQQHDVGRRRPGGGHRHLSVKEVNGRRRRPRAGDKHPPRPIVALRPKKDRRGIEGLRRRTSQRRCCARCEVEQLARRGAELLSCIKAASPWTRSSSCLRCAAGSTEHKAAPFYRPQPG